jgi:hypothetical protein
LSEEVVEKYNFYIPELKIPSAMQYTTYFEKGIKKFEKG